YTFSILFTSQLNCFRLLSFPTRRSSDLLDLEVGKLLLPQSLQGAAKWYPGASLRAGHEGDLLCLHRLGRAKGQRGERHADTAGEDRKSTRLNSSHVSISYAVFCLKKKIQ